MRIPSFKLKQSIRPFGAFLIWAAIFALSYAQAPLFTSNQNQYFLHGLARAGYGQLSADWLANTLDPTPLFSLLVELIYRAFANTSIYYLIYALLMGVYLYALVGIVTTLFRFEDSKVKSFAFFSALVLVHSAALRYLLTTLLGDQWTYALEGGLAGQRLLGEVLQPSTFGVLLLLSLYFFLRARPIVSAALLSLAASVHPTYLLSAALLALAYMVVTIVEQRHYKSALQIGLTALLLVAPILVYSFTVFLPTSPEVYAETRHTLVHFRIPHHAVPAQWLNDSALFQVALVVLALYLVRKSRLFWVLALSTAMAALLTLIQVLTGSDSLALLFPWRLSVLLVPLSTAILVAFLLGRIWTRFATVLVHYRKLMVAVISLGLLALVGVGLLRFGLEVIQKRTAPDRPMMAFVSQNLESGQFYMLPIDLQDFRLATGAPAVVDFKAIPYQDLEVAQWLTRLNNVHLFYLEVGKPGNCRHMERIALEFVATHLVVPKENFDLSCAGLELLYRDQEYAVFYITPPQE